LKNKIRTKIIQYFFVISLVFIGHLAWATNVPDVSFPFVLQLNKPNAPWAAINALPGIYYDEAAHPVVIYWNDDAFPDLMVGGKNGKIGYYQNDGDGYLTYMGELTDNNGIIDVGDNAAPTFGDWVRDSNEDKDLNGDTDLIVGNKAGTLALYKNDGNNGFINQGNLQVTGVDIDVGSYSTPFMADVYANGIMELLVGNQDGTVNFYTQDNDGVMTDRGTLSDTNREIDVGFYSDPFVMDWDGINGVDLLVANSGGKVALYLIDPAVGMVSNGNLQFDGRDLYVVDQAIHLMDWNGDGNIDLISGESNGKINLFLGDAGDASREFHKVEAAPIDVGTNSSVQAVDWDGNGTLDLIIDDDSHIHVYLQDGSGNLVNQGYLQADNRDIEFEEDVDISIVDWDGDGDLDLLLGFNDNNIYLYTRDGGTLDPGIILTDSNNVPINLSRPQPAAGDWDGDGDIDLLVGASDGGIWYYERDDNDASLVDMGRLSHTNGIITVSSNPSPTIVDFNGDECMDLVVGNTQGEILYFEREKDEPCGILKTPVNVRDKNDLKIDVLKKSDPTFADWDKDGDLDMLVGSAAGIVYLYNNLEDNDGDGFLDDTDCDDSDAAINTSKAEICGDGKDNNCDGQVDEGCVRTTATTTTGPTTTTTTTQPPGDIDFQPILDDTIIDPTGAPGVDTGDDADSGSATGCSLIKTNQISSSIPLRVILLLSLPLALFVLRRKKNGNSQIS